jgi:hypothetical protein
MTATLRNSPRPALTALVLAVGAAVALPGCGGDDDVKVVDASKGEPFKVSATGSFAENQSLGATNALRITVRNDDDRTIPNVAVIVKGLEHRIATTNNGTGKVADPDRPVWAVDTPPPGAQTSYVNTWALGPLKAGDSKTFRWKLTPVVPGTHEVTWRVAGGLVEDGPVKASDGGTDRGAFTVRIGRTR